MDYKTHFKGKKIVVMGLDPEGRGVQDIEFLASLGAQIVGTDLKSSDELAESIERLSKLDNCELVLGEHRLEDFQNSDLVIRAASTPLDSKFILEAKKHHIQIETDETLFLSLAPKLITIGITGTRGKSTTTHLIYEILKRNFASKSQSVFLGGNVRGLALLPLLSEVKENDIVVMELSSWQLQAFGENKISPHIAVFTNFMQDHLNYYENDLNRYLEDKAQIFLHQKQNDYLVTTPQVAHLITAKYFGRLYHDPIAVSKYDFPVEWSLKIHGDHNRENAALAIEVAMIIGIPERVIKEAVESFTAVPGRLQFLKNYKGISIYNDNNSTTPDATVAGLQAVGDRGYKKIVLIVGGADKNIDTKTLVEEIPNYVKAVVTLPGTGTERLQKELKKLSVPVVETSSMKEAVEESLRQSTLGNTLLFSPGFASFGPPPGGFKNEYDRGDQFLELINGLE